ncbi:hypothetical protein HMPREF1986_01816 [Oribacterium sp. oral taxon 078 str. F0263]|nr:hypothetical protein HMPREF1986_01816 [Oribacterium sp. oral taxon 078 str. F0263]
MKQKLCARNASSFSHPVYNTKRILNDFLHFCKYKAEMITE